MMSIMTDKTKKFIEDLREHAWWASCNEWEVPITLGENLCTAADLIESLAAELERVTQERDGLSIMLTAAESAAETYKQERDAAVKDLTLWGCFSCKHAGYAHSEICASCIYNRNRIAKGYVSGKNRYEWRGVKEE